MLFRSNGTNGAPGATGATGPSNVYLVSIPSFTLSTSTIMGSATSTYFGILEANKSYSFQMILRGQSTLSSAYFGLTLAASGSGNSLSYEYSVSAANDVRSSNEWKGYQFRVIGTIIVSSATSSLSVSIWDGRGATNSVPMTISGTAIFTLVGSIAS